MKLSNKLLFFASIAAVDSVLAQEYPACLPPELYQYYPALVASGWFSDETCKLSPLLPTLHAEEAFDAYEKQSIIDPRTDQAKSRVILLGRFTLTRHSLRMPDLYDLNRRSSQMPIFVLFDPAIAYLI